MIEHAQRKIFTVYVTAQVASVLTLPEGFECSPKVVFGRYTGMSDDDDAPGWVKEIVPNEIEYAVRPRGDVADVFLNMAFQMPNLMVVSHRTV